MIQYSKLTVARIIEEALFRLGKHRDEINLGYESMIELVNMSAREVQFLTVPYKDWAYTAKKEVTHLTPIPKNFIKHIRLLVDYCGEEEEETE